VFDAGTLDPHVTPRIEHTFPLVNTMSRPLAITGTRRSCDCASATLAADRLEPGQATTLTMSLSVAPLMGRRLVTCTLATDDPRVGEIVYAVQYHALPRLVLEPSFASLGRFGPGAEEGPSSGAEPVQVLAHERGGLPGPVVVTVPDMLIVRLETGTARGIGEGYHQRVDKLWVEPRADALQEFGVHAESVRVKLAGVPEQHLAVSWGGLPPVAAVPPAIHFGTLAPGAAEERRTVLLRSREPKWLRDASFQSDEPALTGVIETPEGGPARLVLTFRPAALDARTGPLHGTASIVGGDDARALVVVPWSALIELK
jgi:hypothetical protein